ncbi:conserved hypothetical protein [Paecilomyces variotii No. 5]|uniref:N-acetyltransferase domain-containing protein n=1 Tax=Byssochlamys spectabilis (strain No. 5 / NBRC 109023) TaxID=1356009 RepID=V5I043_BYSSN|nr:conserved hypothetical protein [Paecilomyces variotii No. 5]
MTIEVDCTVSPTTVTDTQKTNIKSSSTLRLEPATVSDVEQLTDVWYAAFGPTLDGMFPNTPAVRQWWNDAHRNDILNKPFQRYVKVTDTAGDGKPIAWAKWDFSTAAERGPRFPPWHEECDKDLCSRFFGTLETERERLLGGKKNYYLDMLATRPEHERRGAGSMLVQWGCDVADKDGVPAYIDASKAGAPLYKRFGFEDRTEPGMGFPDIVSMVREPKPRDQGKKE